MKASGKLLVPLVILYLAGCTEPTEIGAEFFREGSLSVDFTDTLTLKVSTFAYDSVVTSTPSRMLVGFHKDPELGKVKASTVFQIEPASEENGDGQYDLNGTSTSYLSTTLVLQYDGYSYYDTLQPITIFVHELTEQLEPDEESGYFYNSTRIRYNPTPLGQHTFRAKPNGTDVVEIQLSDQLGEEIFTAARTGGEELSTTSQFVDKILKGLVLSPGENPLGPVLGFATTVELRINYLDRSQVPSTEKHLTFNTSGELRFNQILADRSETLLNALQEREETLSSQETDRTSYLQGGVPLSIRVEIPYLRSLYIDNSNLIITNAVLSIRPVKNSDKVNAFFPRRLKLYAINGKNEIYADLLTNITSDGFIELEEDTDLNRDTRYSVDVTNFVKSQLSIEEFNKNGLMISLRDDEITSTLNRLYIGDQRNDFEMELKVYFAVIR